MNEPLYYGQNLEDKWIAENLPLPDKGFYVDIGAGHPLTTSNTAFLRDRQWEGLAIDGSNGWADDWKDTPGFICAVISTDPTVLFAEDAGNRYWSRIVTSDGQMRETATIEELLAQFNIGKIDFLSVDTEGTELEVIQSFDFDKHDPSTVIVEYNAAHLPIVEPQDSPVPEFMAEKGYVMKKVFPPVNMIFAK